MVLTRTPSPWMLRKTARNRVGHELTRAPGGESPATALAAPSDPIYPLRSSRREQVADPQARPVSRRPVREVTTVWPGRSDWSRRDTRR
jgi:hypothetical protein